MSNLQTYYPVIQDGKELYRHIDSMTDDDFFANCGLMLAQADHLRKQADILEKHSGELKNYAREKRERATGTGNS
jgi:hypothetical protein